MARAPSRFSDESDDYLVPLCRENNESTKNRKLSKAMDSESLDGGYRKGYVSGNDSLEIPRALFSLVRINDE